MATSALNRSLFARTSRQLFSGFAAFALFGLSASSVPPTTPTQTRVALGDVHGPSYPLDLIAGPEAPTVEITADELQVLDEPQVVHELQVADELQIADEPRVAVVAEALSAPELMAAPITPPLAWGAAVTTEFRDGVRRLCENLGCAPDHLMAAIAFETSETFSPSIRNRVSGATGLIQFMSSTAREMGTTTDDLAELSATDQLWYVERYFRPYRGRLSTLEDVYMAILWPRAVGQPNEYGLFTEGSAAYSQNAYLDLDADGTITKHEASAHVAAKLDKGMQPRLRA